MLLTPDELAAIRERFGDENYSSPLRGDANALLAHVDAQQAEIERWKASHAALLREVQDAAESLSEIVAFHRDPPIKTVPTAREPIPAKIIGRSVAQVMPVPLEE